MVMIYILFSPHRLQLADAVQLSKGTFPFNPASWSLNGRAIEGKRPL
jgi:hypothetical protein